MKAVIAGESRFAPIVKQYIEESGFEIEEIKAAKELKELPINTPVVLLGDAFIDPFLTDDAYMQRILTKLGVKSRIVFQTDDTTDNYVFRLIFNRAKQLAGAHRRVAVMTHSVLASGMEDLYAQAREAGVSFIRYEDKPDMKNAYIVNCPGSAGIPDDLWLALRTRKYGEKWFDIGGQSSRRGVFVLTDAMLSEADKYLPAAVYAMSRIDVVDSEKPVVDSKKCAFCYTCYRVCPHAALKPDENAAAMKADEKACAACAMCVAICPAGAITFGGQKADKKAPIAVFACENSAAKAAESAFSGFDIDVIRVPCGGSIKASDLAAELKTHKGVLAAVCVEGACRHYDGSGRASQRCEKLQGEIDKLKMASGRVGIVKVSGASVDTLREAAERLMKEVES